MRFYKQLVFKLIYQSGLVHAIGSQVGKHHLTVLAYHRIAEYAKPGIDTYLPNISATPTAFAQQMDYLQKYFNVISLTDLMAWYDTGALLPPNPALITFDDGYRDNFECALPILKERNMPAVIFLATNFIEQGEPFHWDIAAYCFYHTRLQHARLPVLGIQHWSTIESRWAIMARWLSVLKQISDAEKSKAVAQLPEVLDIEAPASAFANLSLTWDQVRTLLDNGIEMGAHTKSHPILTRVSLAEAKCEISGAKAKIEQETERRVRSFAYPNGSSHDFSASLHQVVQDAGISLGFTLLPPPTSLQHIHRSPIAIRRAFIHHKDTLERFAAKLIGVGRIVRTLA